MTRLSKLALGATTALALVQAAPAFAQITPGDRSGTAEGAGSGQSAATATAAPAEEAEVATTDGPGDIVVTARRVEERLQDVPISITVFNQQQITNRNIVNAQDLATYTPSLSANSNYGTEFSSFAIRGFVQDPGTAQSVGVYFADVVVPRGPTQGTQAGDGAGPGNLFDLQNVQVLKGPQGTLFGRNTTGGAVLFVPQKPTGRFEGYLEGSYGNYDMKRLQGALNIPLSDRARFRIAADYLNRDGWLKNDTGIGPRRFNDVNYISVRASLVLDLTPDLENYTIASYTRSDTNGSSKKTFACAPTLGFGAALACPQIARERAAGAGFYTFQNVVPDPASILDQWQLINTTTWKASDTLTIKNIASYAELNVFQRAPLFGTDFRLGIPALGIPVQNIYFATINPAPNLRSVDSATFTEELQLQGGTADQKLTYQGGVYYEQTTPNGEVGNMSPFLIAARDIYGLQATDILGIGASAQTRFAQAIRVGAINVTTGQTRFRNVGTYAQASYALTEQVKLTGGIRYTWDRSSNTSRRFAYSFPVTPPFTQAPVRSCTDPQTVPSCAETIRQKSDKPTWLAGVDFKPTEAVLLYGKYTRGYRAGGVFPNGPRGNRIFNPEKVDSYEAGFKTSFAGAIRGTFNASGFYNDFSNQQIQFGFTARPGAPVSSTNAPVNAGKSRIYGAEVEASVSPFQGLNLDGSYTYLHTEVRSIATVVSVDPNYTADAGIRPGDPLGLSPRHKFSVSANYTLPLDESIGRISFGATYSYSSSQYSTFLYRNSAVARTAFAPSTITRLPGGAFGAVDLGRIQSFDLLNLNVNWNRVLDTPVDLSLFATNVTKEKYISYTAGTGNAGFESGVHGEPRMYGVRLRYRFGA